LSAPEPRVITASLLLEPGPVISMTPVALPPATVVKPSSKVPSVTFPEPVILTVPFVPVVTNSPRVKSTAASIFTVVAPATSKSSRVDLVPVAFTFTVASFGPVKATSSSVSPLPPAAT
jgi:hypothetical protein